MRYHYEKPSIVVPMYGETYLCDHPIYRRCTLYTINDTGLCVIQQRYSPTTKRTWWSEIDDYVRNDLYLHPKFLDYYKRFAKAPENGIYPTVTIRQIMWALKMKPLKREIWETCFDHSPI